MQALIDADIIAVRFACKHEVHHKFPDNEFTKPDDPPDFVVMYQKEAEQDCDRFIKGLLFAVGTVDYVLCFTGSDNFRKALSLTYKHNRLGKPQPILRQPLVDYMKGHHPYLQRRGLEADDQMGIHQTRRNAKGEPTIICTIDKDLDQIPGMHYNWNSGETYSVNPEEGVAVFYRQCLTGDATDGYGGCPGIGPVKAATILHGLTFAAPADIHEGWRRIVKAYEDAGLTEEDALDTAHVALILQDKYFKEETSKVLLWNTPGKPLKTIRLPS